MTLFNTRAITAANLSTVTGGMTSTLIVLAPANLQVVDAKGNVVGTVDLVKEAFVPIMQPTS